jgi:hypothetical protein
MEPLALNDLVTKLICALTKRLGDLIHLFGLEAQLAGKTFVNLMVLTFFVGSLLTTAWLCMLVLIAVFIISTLHYSWLFSLAVVTALNLFLLFAVCAWIINLTGNLRFKATRGQLRKNEVPYDDRIKAENKAS